MRDPFNINNLIKQYDDLLDREVGEDEWDDEGLYRLRAEDSDRWMDQ